MPEILDSCPICESAKSRHFLSAKDYTVSWEIFDIVQCQNCGFKFTNPRPDENEIVNYYQSEEYISHSDTRKGLINRIYHLVRKQALKGKLNLINNLFHSVSGFQNNSKGSLLDYGCGTGAFLKICQEKGWQIEGIEPEEKARSLAENSTGKKIQNSIFDVFFEDKKFDVITLWHVLEHVHQLDKSLEKLKELLQPQGYLLIAVPNNASKDAQFYGRFWAAYDVPRHLYHFTPQTMQLLLGKHQLKIVKYLPMYFDAFYISLLSERYQKGKNNYLKAFYQGLQSNFWAGRNKNNYSSVIYIVQK